MDAFPKAIIHSKFWDPWSVETSCQWKKTNCARWAHLGDREVNWHDAHAAVEG